MRMRDVYATLRERVPALLDRSDGLRLDWTPRADPIWRRGERWVRVEALTSHELIVLAGSGERVDEQRTYAITADLEPIAGAVAALLNAAPASA